MAGTDKIMDLLLQEIRHLADKVGALDVRTESLIVEVRATQKADQKSLATLTHDVEDLKKAVDNLREADHLQDLEAVTLKMKYALPAGVAGFATAVAALIAAIAKLS